MNKKRLTLGILTISTGLILSILAGKGFGDDAGDPYSDKLATSIGAWYDETWQASGFYRLERIGSSDNFRYEYTTTPNTTSNPTFTEDGSAADKETFPEAGHKHDYTDATSGTSLPQDMVVTEWEVTGHVHFSSGI